MRTITWLLLMFILGACGLDTEEAGASDDTQVSAEEQASSSYFPMGFARVSAEGAVLTSFNSNGRTVSVSRGPLNGRYFVTFAGLGIPLTTDSSGGNVQVTAEGTSNAYCRAHSWGGSPDLSVTVDCHAPNEFVDSSFAILFFRRAMPAPNQQTTMAAYTWVLELGEVAPRYDYNSSGTHNIAVRNHTGSYTVTIPNATAYNASIMITTNQYSRVVCSIVAWGTGTMWIECRNHLGNPADSAFTLSYSVLGSATDQQGGHTWFDGASANGKYTGAVGKWWCSPRSVSGSRNGSLASIVVSGELGSWDAIPFRRASLISKYGSAGYCKVESLSSDEGPMSTATTTVRCYSATGAVLSVPKFTFTHVTSDTSGPC